MSSDLTIETAGLGKAYLIYDRPEDRLKQMIWRKRKKFFQEYWAFQNIDLSIARKEAVGIIGRNGSGKSTLLQVLAGTLHPSTGTVNVRGRIAPLLELGAGFNPEFTGRENVRLAASLLGLQKHEIEERFEDILAFAGIGDFVDQPVKTYSSGMYARLAFAVCAHVDADILIVDEILSVGDAAFHQKCMRFVHQFKEKGTLLFVSHDTAAVNAICDRAVWMDKGQMRADGSTEEVGFAYQAALREELDGGGFQITGRRRQEKRQIESVRDFRHEIIAQSDKRNTLEVFAFDKDAPAYGVRGGEVVDVNFRGGDGEKLPVMEGGEHVTLEVRCRASSTLTSPIIGFFVRDRLGQNLFGDNTYLTYADRPLVMQPGTEFTGLFKFRMPYLPAGDFSVTVALAEGSQSEHVQHHWVDEALIFHCSGSHLAGGLIGLPMEDIRIA
ncbi:ABC transporter ATP-binding protein [Aureimonas sp. Leaf454]|uniref:ABC transporter ATP-binding protein n=1 Tax=Aureimonas sp. Leaf454 TaxID=1736381 RepID=UPI0006FEEBD8|nr:ABC transporter ATP-binding protein [Aureimonas sp. Leaf454]KQT51946.1 ABC transporter ATP-binding protein [Aureimonas sp. Leaf454]